MSTREEIQAAINRLNPDERRRLALWLARNREDLPHGLAACLAEQEPGESLSHETPRNELGLAG